jgi:D-alanyl-lipoteichoic acid acyltransferase DltB (MBOAT superfamily)
MIVALVFYWLAPGSGRWIVLLIFSILFFFFASGWRMLLILLYGVLVSWGGAMLIERNGSEKQRGIVLFGTIVALVVQLVVLKYLNFLMITGNFFGSLFNVRVGLNEISLIAPIGLSYYTLSLIGYVTDVYRRRCSIQGNLAKHALFTCYFPQLTSGPIIRYGDMQSEFFTVRPFELNYLAFGMQRMVWGYLKKMVIADRIAIFVNTVYADTDTCPGGYIFVASVLVAAELYCDFSGCMDIIIGASETLGIRLPENFNTPFFSKNISEFWRRWHITLGLWAKDYILYPLLKSDSFQYLGQISKKRFGEKIGKKIPVWIALTVIWFAIGMWHGGAYKWLFISGFVPGCYLIASDLTGQLSRGVGEKLKINMNCFSFDLFRMFRTTALMWAVWVFLPASGLAEGAQAWKQMLLAFNIPVLFDGSILNLGLSIDDFLILLFGLIAVFVVDLLHYRGASLRTSLQLQNTFFRWAINYLGLFGILLFGIYGPGYDSENFLYAGF